MTKTHVYYCGFVVAYAEHCFYGAFFGDKARGWQWMHFVGSIMAFISKLKGRVILINISGRNLT